MADFNCIATGIGSMPHSRASKALDAILRNFPDMPFWPQMSSRGFYENMYIQCSGRMPCLSMDYGKGRAYFDTGNKAGELEEFYNHVLSNDLDYFRISKKYALGLDRFLNHDFNSPFVKGQVTGPVSFSLAVKDNKGLPILYDEDIFEAVSTALGMKAAWQAEQLKKKSGNVAVFFDEPYLSVYGSAFFSLSEAQVRSAYSQALPNAKNSGAAVGLHCCGNTDWGLVMSLGIDVLSFDAYNYGENFLAYSGKAAEFLKESSIAWGIVPTSNELISEDAQSLAKKLESQMGRLAGVGTGAVMKHSIITPSCGTGTMNVKDAERALRIAAEVSGLMQKK